MCFIIALYIMCFIIALYIAALYIAITQSNIQDKVRLDFTH